MDGPTAHNWRFPRSPERASECFHPLRRHRSGTSPSCHCGQQGPEPGYAASSECIPDWGRRGAWVYGSAEPSCSSYSRAAGIQKATVGPTLQEKATVW